MANPNALLVAMAAYQGIMAVGMPEARILLSEAAIMVATSPKSNSSYSAIDRALSDIEKKRTGSVPMHLRNAPAKGMLDLGYPGNVCAQQYLPDEMVGTVYYRPNDNGYEKKVQEFLSERDKQLRS